MSNLKQKRFVDTDYFHEQLDSTTVEVEGSHISATETKIGYLKDVEILGNTIQNASNLAKTLRYLVILYKMLQTLQIYVQ